jgi:hypothetical protein
MPVIPGPPPVRFVLVPGLGLDERSSRRLRARLAVTVVPLPGMGWPSRSLEVLADMTPQTHPDGVAVVLRSW